MNSSSRSRVPSRAYVAHDRVVSAARMYIQMGVIGVLLAAILYGGEMSLFLSYYVSKPIPELQYVDGEPRLILRPNPRRLGIISLVKYFASFNPKNYFNLKLSTSPSKVFEKSEIVEPEMRPFFHRSEVPRETYRKAVLMITHGRVEQLRWIFPISLLFFPIFGFGYFFGFSWLNRRTEKTEFVRGDDLMPFNEMKSALNQAVKEEANGNSSFVPLCLGEAALPDSVSRRNILLLGTSGTGKSVCLNHYLATLKARRASTSEVNKCVIYDVKGEFCGEHLENDDLIFYPFDKRSVPWSFFNEVLDYPDLDVLCTSLYEPPKDSKDAYWYNAARDVFRTGLFYLLREGRTKNRQIWEFFSQPLHHINNPQLSIEQSTLGPDTPIAHATVGPYKPAFEMEI